jgi:putative ABC transport system permease protein
VTLSDRLLGVLLRAYPGRVRARFGDGMRDALRRDLGAARARGLSAACLFWMTTIADVSRFGFAERREGWRMRGMFTVDWRDAWRSLRAAPMVTAFAVASLALGIGGVTALFSIMNALALKPLPVREPDRLVLLSEAGATDTSWNNPIWEAVRDRRQAFADGAFAWAADRFNLSSTSASDIVDGIWVSGSMFDVLGVAPILGRSIDAADDVRGGGQHGAVVMISHGFWQRRFGGDPGVLGRTLSIERVPFTIVGVTPEGFFGPDVGRAFDVAIPLGTEPVVRPRDHALDQRSTWWMNVMARLKPGQTVEQATASLQTLQPAVRAATMPPARQGLDAARYMSAALILLPAAAGRSPLRRQYREPLTLLLWASGLVLLIASANVANLLIARASARRQELTLRAALGASRFRIARQLLAESIVLAAAGAALGLALANWGSRALIAQLTTFSTAVRIDLGLDWRVLLFTTAVAGGAALLFGVAPALALSRVSPHEVLKAHGRTSSERHGRVRQASVILQIALSLTLVVAAGLFTRTFVTLTTKDAGFTRTGVLLVTANVDRNPVEGPPRVALFERFEEAARGVPGTEG